MIKQVLSLILTLFVIIPAMYAQERISSEHYFFVRLGYNFDIFTNSDVYDIYPVINFKEGTFMKEVSFEAGYRLHKKLSLSFTPSLIFTSTSNNKGFNFYNAGYTKYYYPVQSDLFLLPLNLNLKIYPFDGKVGERFYFSASGGSTYIKEEYNNLIYATDTSVVPLGSAISKNSFWRQNITISVGMDFLLNRYGLNIEAGYRFIPLAINSDKPLVSSFAGNFNYVYLGFKGFLNIK
ncbi:MAG: hypothetical protein ACP5P3_10130 [Ignavibacteria bacterium]